MGRPKKEEYWSQVTKEESGAWKCNHCERKFKGGASRIKAHLERIEGKGIEVCKGPIDRDPQEAGNAMNPMEEAEGGHDTIDANIGGSMDHQTNTESINLLGVAGHEMDDANIGGSMDHQTNTESINLLRGSAPVHAVSVTRRYNSAYESKINRLNELMHDLTREVGDIKGQLEWLQSRGKKRKRLVDDWLNKVQNLKTKASHMNNLDQLGLVDLYSKEIQQLTKEVREHKEQKPLVLSNELVGESFESVVKKMWELLEDDQVFIIGIHGMGGVGKTCLVTYMENEIKRKGAFKHFFWVTVSHDFSILKLQTDIAERIGVKLNADDERTRAENLSLALETKERSVLILDDVWKYIDLEKVGIPLRLNGIKLILTSRLKHVCQQMDCSPNNIITMCPLFEEEAWELFLLKLGHHETPAALPPNVLEIARSLARECDGLPLGINVMARTMKGVSGIHHWRHVLNKLRNSSIGEEMKEEVFNVLKLSYDNLVAKGMQNCFLHCALYYDLERADLVMKLVEDGIIIGTRSLKEKFDEGYTILDELTGHSLLLDEGNYLRMHDLMKDMACHIMKKSHRYMIKGDNAKMPQKHEWTPDSEEVYLIPGFIEIPADTAPYCPRLSTLMIGFSCISQIPECFFTHMNALAILVLSHNDKLRSLPDSLSNLRSLTSLLLRQCDKLEYVPPLGELRALSRLVISHTSIEEVRGLEMLINLKWLDLSGNKKLRLTPGTVLASLTNLQYLNLRCAGSINVKLEDVQEMTMLECFGGSFCDRESYNNYVQEIQNRGYRPENHHLLSGDSGMLDSRIILEGDVCQTVAFGDCEESSHLLPTDLARLSVSGNNHWICLCRALTSNCPSSLRAIKICACTKLKSLFCSSGKCTFCTNLRNFESLDLFNLACLTDICKEDVADRSLALSPNGMFSHLRHLYIQCCDGIETLLTPGSLSQLQNLETVSVKMCSSLREIFAVGSGDGDDDGYSITLPKLTKLKVGLLPLLETICKGTIVSASLPELFIYSCPNLERVPTIKVFS